MMLMVHIFIALTSIAYATYAVLRPSKRALTVNYSLVGATIASGTYLVISLHAPLLRTCLTGLVYLAVVAVLLVGISLRLAATNSNS